MPVAVLKHTKKQANFGTESVIEDI